MRVFGIICIIINMAASAANAIDWWSEGNSKSLLIAFLLVVIALNIAAQVVDLA